MAFDEKLKTHLATGVTTLCHAWAIRRQDGVEYGFTDHDLPLTFEGIEFRADRGLSAAALLQSTGLSVDNSEASGALTDAAIREEDIDAGRFDGAEVRAWLVNWQDSRQRVMQFRGSIGELTRIDGAFRAELRGLSAALNRPMGRVYQKPCAAVLGDGTCRFDLTTPGYWAERLVEEVTDRSIFGFAPWGEFEPGWFMRGRLIVLSGRAEGLEGMIKRDHLKPGARLIELWQPLRAEIRAGDRVRLEAGCDKRMETCRLKFNNILNFQGFPDLPGEDWMMIQPVQARSHDGGSRR